MTPKPPESIQSLSHDWRVGFSRTPDALPSDWMPATVPGAVQLDYARAHGWPAHWEGNAFEAYAWMEEVWWHYETRLPKIPEGDDTQLWWDCGGIDYRWSIWLEHQLLRRGEGMFQAIRINLGKHRAQAGDRLRICIDPIPKLEGESGRWQANRSCKPPCSYGWDWHPRLVPSGIWREALLERGSARLHEVDVRYTLDLEQRCASVTCQVESEACGPVQIHCTVQDPDGTEVARHVVDRSCDVQEIRFSLENLALWWPHDHGEPSCYTFAFALISDCGTVLHACTRRIGFRQTRLVMHEPEWQFPDRFPKSRTRPPMTLEINGKAIFAKGSNWVPPEIFPGSIDTERYRTLLELAKQANFNLLRIWGGGIVNPPAFYELCDALGLMVWTEFPLACLPYEDDPDYLAVLEQESEAILRRIRSHACNVLWCGGNELFNSWSGMTDQSLALRLLNSQCLRLDPHVPFLPTSPIDGVGHGPYLFRDADGTEVFEMFDRASHTAYTEFGCPGLASRAVLESFMPPDELWPPRPGTAWESHHAFNAWVYGGQTTWLCTETLEFYFGPSNDLDTLIERGQWLQSIGYQYQFEACRRQKPVCSMALNWCFNEPWPSAANNSLVSWPDLPKPALQAVQRACRPTCLCARLPKFQWFNDEIFEAEIWLLHDRYEALPAATVCATVTLGNWTSTPLIWHCEGAAPNANVQGPSLRLQLPRIAGVEVLLLELHCETHPQWNQHYHLSYRPTCEIQLYGVAARKALNT